VGAGAIGGLIGTRLAAAGAAEVSAYARGDTLAALREQGWRLRRDGVLTQIAARAESDARQLGEQDVVVIAVKAPALAQVAPAIAPLIGPDTVVMPAMNGVPWWFCQGDPRLGDAPLESVDPGGRIAAQIGFGHVVGCVVHISASTPEPGMVEHAMGLGLTIGEPAGGSTSPRIAALESLLAGAGFDVTVSPNIREEIWYKLWGNLTMNPVSAITGATMDRILADPLVRRFCSAVMEEASAVGNQIGCTVRQSPEDRHAITAKLGAFRSSMLQDVDARRAIELDAIVGAVQEIGRRLGIATPNVDALFGLTRLFGRVRGLYPESR